MGDQVFVLDTRDDGSRVIGQTAVVGESGGAGSARRFLIADGAAGGSPVLNGSGEQIGMVAAGDEPSLGEAGSHAFGTPRHQRGASLIGMDGIAAASGAGTTLAQMAAQGHFMRPLSPESRHVIKLRKGEPLFSTWSFSIARLPSAVYRVDLLLGGEPVWRGFVRVTD